MKPYYYVLNKTQKIAPTFQHKTLEDATTEAEADRRNSSYERGHASYRKGRLDALTALKNSLK